MQDSADYVPLVSIDRIPAGTMKVVSYLGQEFLVAHVGEEFFVTDNRCPHMGGRLTEGALEGTTVICHRHHSRFDLRDGQVLQWTDFKGAAGGVSRLLKRPRSLRTFATKLEGNMLLIGPENSHVSRAQ